MNQFWIRVVAALPLADTTILFEEGTAIARRGKVRPRLLVGLTDLARSTGVRNACIHASVTGPSFKLRFIGIPPALYQRFRNVWGVTWK